MESRMVRYFKKGSKPSFKAEIDQDASHLNNYEELVAKAVRANAKTGLQPSCYVQETNQQISQENWRVYTTAYKIQTQKAIKDFCGDESKAKASVPTSTQDSEPSNNTRKDKKKK